MTMNYDLYTKRSPPLTFLAVQSYTFLPHAPDIWPIHYYDARNCKLGWNEVSIHKIWSFWNASIHLTYLPFKSKNRIWQKCHETTLMSETTLSKHIAFLTTPQIFMPTPNPTPKCQEGTVCFTDVRYDARLLPPNCSQPSACKNWSRFPTAELVSTTDPYAESKYLSEKTTVEISTRLLRHRWTMR